MRLAVLVVTWNNRDTIKRCLELARASSSAPEVRLLVWDNASRDGTVAIAKAAAPDAEVFASTENVGFAQGVNNLALNAEADVLLLLNPDAYLRLGAID